ncbi:MAG: insulinase family protein [Kiritimatiellae bacterium]|nr:insulinase family protein [Kiritimatiellia bacterium]
MKTRRPLAVMLALLVFLPGCLTNRSAVTNVEERSLAAIRRTNESLKRIVLENGLICLLKKDASAPVVSVQIWVGTGSIHEQEYLGAGLSHAIEHMIFKGTKKRGVGALTREINDAGGRINAYTSYDRTVFHADLPANGWRVGLETLADAIMHSSFPKDEWEKERKVILREFAMGKDDPRRVLGKLSARTAYTVHPYKHPIIGHEAVFKQISRDDIATFFQRNYVPDNMMVVIVGDINATEVEATIRDIFKDFKRKRRAPVMLPKEPEQISPRFARETGAYSVSRLDCSYHTVSLNHQDTPALDILANVVGKGRSSRLVSEIKEKQKLVHSISAWSYTPKEPGTFSISATFSPDKEKEVLAAIQKEIQTWLTKGFSEKEINKARRMIITSELSELQTMKGQARNYAVGEFYAGNAKYSETYLNLLAEISPDDLLKMVAKYLLPNKRTVAILSPTQKATEEKIQTDRVSSPKVTNLVTSNGITLLLREDHRLPFVYVCAAFRGGLLSENDKNNGITRLAANLLTRGTKTRSSEQLARQTDSLGGQLYAFSGYNTFGLRAKCLSNDADTFMSILADCLLNAEFPEGEIAKQKKIQTAAINQKHDDPFFLAAKALRRLLFPDHPYRWNTLGSEKTLTNITRPDLHSYLHRHITSKNLVLAVFGDITPDRAQSFVETHLSALPSHPAPVHKYTKTKHHLPAKTKQRAPKEQTILLAGFPSVNIADPRREAISIIDSALSGLSSDLGMEVREKRGLVYYVGAYQQTGIDPGMFVLYAGIQEKNASEVEKLMLEELKRIKTKGIRQEELDRARSKIIASHEMGLQDNSRLTMTCAIDELLGLGYQHTFTTKKRYDSLTLKNIKDTAQSLFSTNKMATSLCLPAKKQKTDKTHRRK